MRKQTSQFRASMVGVAAAILIVSTTLAASSANYRLDFYQMGAGGSESSASASYRLASTIGQGVAGNTGSLSYRAFLGYRQPFNTPVPSNTPGGPTDTPRPTFTPIPTVTPAPTDTPGGPTNTPRPTGTPTPTNTPPGPTPTTCPVPFVDISGNVFRGAIVYLYCRSVVNGTDSTHYTPAGTSTRGQFAKVVVLGFGTPFYTPPTPSFTDVPATYFAYLYIESGFHSGVLSGFDAATCHSAGLVYPCYLPNRAITRGQLTKLVVNAAHYLLYTPDGGIPTFNDVPTSNVFFVSIETAAHKGVVNGYPDHTFRPNNNIRRDEMAQIVYKGVTTPLL